MSFHPICDAIVQHRGVNFTQDTQESNASIFRRVVFKHIRTTLKKREYKSLRPIFGVLLTTENLFTQTPRGFNHFITSVHEDFIHKVINTNRFPSPKSLNSALYLCQL